MAQRKKPSEVSQPDIVEQLRRRDQPTVDAPATVPHPSAEVGPAGSRPPEDGGVPQHPVHDSDVEDMGPEDYEELTDEVAKVGIKPES